MLPPRTAETAPPVEPRPVVPIVEEIRPAPAPEHALRRLGSLPWTLFLDSAAIDGVHGRHSYLTASPVRTLRALGTRVRVESAQSESLDAPHYGVDAELDLDPFAAVRAELARWNCARIASVPAFQGGAAGLFGYGLSSVVERVPPNRFDEFRAPDLAVGIYDWVIAWDHARDTCHLVSLGIPEADANRRRDRAARRAASVRRWLASSSAVAVAPERPAAIPLGDLAPSFDADGHPGLLSNFTKDAYVAAVARAIEYVLAGDIFQVNLSQRFLFPQRAAPLDFYAALRNANPAPFAGYFDIGDLVVSSSSPEQFLSLERDEVITRPIKGTRSRGYTAEEDVYRRLDLHESEKDRAENVMIVDLLRNDLSRVCRPHTVEVRRLFELERHPTVHHLVSEVRGRLRENHDALDLLRASFPGGSITGAPKVRAMEIIAELEPTARGAYCGSLAWIALHGDLGSSILIRTVTDSRGWLQMPAGGGIVADSRPESEYQETLDKAAGMLRALR